MRFMIWAAAVLVSAGCEAGDDAEVSVDAAPACRPLAPEVRANVETWTVIECRNETIDGCAHCEIDTPYLYGTVATWTVPGVCEVFEACSGAKTHH